MNFIRKRFNNLSYDKKQALRVIKYFFWKINWLKTLWLNLKILPFCDAIKCPILVAYNVKIKNVGKVLFTNDIYTGMVSIGVIRIDALETNQFPTIFNNKGTFLISGALKMHPGSCLFVASNASLSTGNHVGFGANTKVVCCKSIIIGDDVRFSWNCQLFDTDFHFLYNIEKKKHYKRLKEIVIGNNVFIGNGSTIGKGTIIPNGCVISCISKVSGDYTNDGENLLLIGNPAKIIKKGVNMGNSWFPEIENEIAKMLKE